MYLEVTSQSDGLGRTESPLDYCVLHTSGYGAVALRGAVLHSHSCDQQFQCDRYVEGSREKETGSDLIHRVAAALVADRPRISAGSLSRVTVRMSVRFVPV